MTTSNHRPFTFPAGRVKERNGTREGAEAYTDWSIAYFLERARKRAYFGDTVFVITADHDASSAGKTSLPVNRYHIPLWIYAPSHFKPERVDRLMGQLDIPPTLLGMLNFSYRTRFFGHDVFQLPPGREHAFPGTYEKLGYLHDDVLTILEPRRRLEQLRPDYATGDATPVQPVNQALVDDAVAYYQVASELFASGAMKRRPEDATKVEPLPLPAPSSSAPAPAASAPSPTAVPVSP
jgi:membrane-anchored protein YejM (alkaline phosphatase superfamily)